MGDIDLTRQGKSWQLAGLADNEELNTGEVDHLLNKISHLTVADVLDPTANAELFKKDPALTVTLKLTDNSDRVYTFAKPDKENHYVLKTSDQDFLFKVNSFVVDDIKKINKNTLVKMKTATEGKEKPAPPAADKE